MVVSAKERFTSVGYDAKGAICKGLARASKTYSERWLIYVCPTGRTEVGFEVADLRKHVGSCFSNLLYQDKQAIEREVMSRLSDENAFADFYCQGCGMAVRVYYRYDPPDQHYGLLHLKTVVEVAARGTKAN